MIVGIGTDIVRVSRMEESLHRFGVRFAERILTPHELNDFYHRRHLANFLAKRFAAKEALFKSLGTGFHSGISLKEIGVEHEASGKPILVCTGKALARLELHQVQKIHLSISDERDYAVAMVVLEG